MLFSMHGEQMIKLLLATVNRRADLWQKSKGVILRQFAESLKRSVRHAANITTKVLF